MKMLKLLIAVVISAMVLPRGPVRGEGLPPGVPPAPPPESAPVPPGPPANVFSNEQLDQMVSPVALYPDSLLMQILMAATYPLELVEADRWVKKNASLKDAELDKALTEKGWDPSVNSLTHFPTVLARMSDNLDWSKDMGDAFLGQQKDVLDAIQRMRYKAYELGNLKSTPEQKVIVEPAKVVVQQAPPQIIKIEPAQPQVVYVPAYNPTVIYGPPPAVVYYPSVMTYPPGYVATTSLLSFGVGMAVGAALWGNCNWYSHRVTVNHHYNYNSVTNVTNVNNINNINNANRPKPEAWKHNPQHRQGVNYRSDAVAKQYGQAGAANRAARESARGYGSPGIAQTRPASANAARPGAGEQGRGARPPAATNPNRAAKAPGGGTAKPARQPGATRPPTSPRPANPARPPSANRPPNTAQPASKERNTAFGGMESGRAERAASTRGADSRGAGGGGSSRNKSAASSGGAARGSGGGRSGGGGRR